MSVRHVNSKMLDGPYKATNIWNEIVASFRAGLCTKRHRRNLRFYDDCFAASDAVDWLLDYLNRNPTFDTVSRNQTVQLLDKFLKNNVIEDVRGGKAFMVNQFLDNRDLYRFSRYSPVKCPRLPLRTCTNYGASAKSNTNTVTIGPMQKILSLSRAAEASDTIKERGQRLVCKKFHQSAVKLPNWQQLPSVAEIENIWKKTLLDKLGFLLNVDDPDQEIFSGVFVNAKQLIHNSTRIGQSGIVDSLDRSRELPPWVLSAMKCLITWPKASGVESCLPNYPGFERDVFKVVRDYFENLDEPLINVTLYNVLTNVYLMAEEFDADLRQPPLLLRQTQSAQSVDAISGRFSKASISSDIPRRQELLNHQLRSPILDVADVAASCPNLSSTSQLSESKPRPNHTDGKFTPFLCFETDFETESPVTHIVRPMRTQSAILHISEEEPAEFQESPRCISLNALSCATKPAASAVLKVLLNESGGYVNLGCNENSPPADLLSDDNDVGCMQVPSTLHAGYTNLGCTEFSNNEEQKDLSQLASTLVDEDFKNVEHSRQRCVRLRRSVSSSTLQIQSDNQAGSETKKPSSDLWTWNPTDKCLRRYDCDPDLHTLDGKRLAVEALRLCLLLLPPDSRRNLHRLLRFMVRVAENKQLQLDSGGLSNRKLVLDAFSNSLLHPASEIAVDESLSARLVTFLVDNHDAILEAPLDLIASVDDQLIAIQKTKIARHSGAGDQSSSTCATSRALTYCEQVSEAEFERQKRSLSERAVADLLDGIVGDRRLSDRDKRKKLKQFKEMYPKIYAHKFPQETAMAARKQSAPTFKKPFKKLLEMRL